MQIDHNQLPDDIEGLRALVLAQKEQLAERDRKLSRLQHVELHNEKLKFELARLKRMKFGRSSEKLASEKLDREI